MRLGFRGSEMSKIRPFPEQAPAAIWQFGENRDVMTMIGLAGVLCIVPVVAALPQPGQAAGGFICKDRGAVDDAGLGRVRQRDFNHVNPEKRRAVITGNTANSPAVLLRPEWKRCRSYKR